VNRVQVQLIDTVLPVTQRTSLKKMGRVQVLFHVLVLRVSTWMTRVYVQHAVQVAKKCTKACDCQECEAGRHPDTRNSETKCVCDECLVETFEKDAQGVDHRVCRP
jgi:hypothetical protein